MRALILLVLCAPGGQEPPQLQVPEGYVIELVAGPPLVERPIMASFDDRGRLYVSDSSGVNHKGPDLLKDPPHKIRLLEDTDGDGKFDKSHVFADKLVFPQGLLWHEGAVYVTSPPGFWKLEDTDGDGVCDKRTELVTGFANTGVADDAHGANLGPDGRIYFLPGRMAHNMRRPDGTVIRKAVGPWLMRMRPDGSDVEIISGSQGNPVEVDWLPEGDFFISGTFWAPDSFGGGLRDCLIHGVEGGEYAVRDRTYNDRKRTGDFLPPLVPMAATAPSGMMIYRSKDFEGDLFCTYFNTHKVQRHVLERDGATFRAQTSDFVSSSNPDFHPTDVLEDADGTVLVVDTGGWFRIGCPTSQIAKPQVLGGIYRVRPKDRQPDLKNGRGQDLKLSTLNPQLLVDLAGMHPRWVVRERAVAELARRGDRAIRALSDGVMRVEVPVALGCVWALTRIDTPDARAHVRGALHQLSPSVRQAAAFSAGLHRDAQAVSRLAEMVVADTPPIRREAATALGRMGDRRAIPAILESLRKGGDRFLEHALIYALIRLADREGTSKALADANPAVRRAALIALDQMDGGDLSADQVTPLLDPIDAALQQAALKVILKRPGWAGEIFGLARQWLIDKSLDPARQDLLRGILVAFASDAAMQDLAARGLREEGTTVETRLLLLESMARAPLERLPATWLAEARWALDHGDERVVRQAVATIRASATGDFDDALLRLAQSDKRSVDLRIEAVGTAAPRLRKLEAPLFDLLKASIDKDRPPLLRLWAAEALGKSPLDDAQLSALAGLLGKAGALELPRLVNAFERSRNLGVGKRLVNALSGASALASLSAENLRRILQNFPEEVRADAQRVLKSLEVDLEQQKAKLRELEPALAKGNAASGRDVFLGKKAGCAACHTVQGQGGRVGPDLSKIGSIRSGRDLLEAIIFPSATFARGFEPFLIRTKDGGIHDGLVVRETPDAIVLFTSERIEKRIPRGSVDVLQQSKLSIMPQGLDTQLSRDELRDLITFLATLK